MSTLLKGRSWSAFRDSSSAHDTDARDAHAQPLLAMSSSDAREMLQLMRSTKGRVKGDVAFRTASYETATSQWSTTYCFVNAETASLRQEIINEHDEADAGAFKTLIPDLRGCTVYAWYDHHSQRPTLFLCAADAHTQLHIRPHNQTHFNTWFAALLCWSPLAAGKPSPHQAVKKLHPCPLEDPFTSFEEEPTPPLAQDEEAENMTLKRDKAIFIDAQLSSPRSGSGGADPRQRQVTVILRGNGELSVRSAVDSSTLATITLGDIPRSAIHRISKTAFDTDRVLAIYPHYATSLQASSRLQPVYLAFSNQDLFEAWFILLRSSALPELYGSKSLQTQDEYSLTDDFPGLDRGSHAPMLRIEQSLEVRVTKAKFHETLMQSLTSESVTSGTSAKGTPPTSAAYYAEILLDEHVHARTKPQSEMRGNLFFNEGHAFEDLPRILSSVTVRVRRQETAQPSPTTVLSKSPTTDRFPNVRPPEDILCGEASIDMAATDLSDDRSKTFPLIDKAGLQTGEITVALHYQRQSILMEHEYHQLLDYLKDFENDVSLQVTDHIPSQNSKLAELFLNIYQASNCAEDWLMELVEEEIYGKEAIDSPQSDGDDNPRSPTRSPRPKRDSHAILLFRGTTMLSKAMDLHMRRCGQAYLEETLGPKLREIRDQDLDCEVDPGKMEHASEAVRNWQSLVNATKGVWTLIAHSAQKCPVEMRTVFHHIRACAQDRYGGTFSSIIYTSVSGFLFLRFFCAAVLNPFGFGLIHGSITPRTQRTFMLIAKSLQGLANMTKFANKETWMAPMDEFTAQHRRQFEDFIDAVCTVPFSTETKVPREQPDSPTLPRPSQDRIDSVVRFEDEEEGDRLKVASDRQSYMRHKKTFSYSKGPLEAVSRRLHPSAREGHLSHPALIDPARNMAALVDLWLDSVDTTEEYSAFLVAKASQDDLARFHRMCLRLQEKAKGHVQHLDMVAESSSTGLVPQKWAVIAENIEARPELYWRSSIEKPQKQPERPQKAATEETKPSSKEKKAKDKDKSISERDVGSSPTTGRAVRSIPEEPDSHRHSNGSVARVPTGDRHASAESTRNQRSSLLTVSSEVESFPPDIRRGRDARPGSSSRNSTGSDKSRGAKSTVSKRTKKKSPPRTKEENAMRKLGWM